MGAAKDRGPGHLRHRCQTARAAGRLSLPQGNSISMSRIDNKRQTSRVASDSLPGCGYRRLPRPLPPRASDRRAVTACGQEPEGVRPAASADGIPQEHRMPAPPRCGSESLRTANKTGTGSRYSPVWPGSWGHARVPVPLLSGPRNTHLTHR
jgi:hypothetical protein